MDLKGMKRFWSSPAVRTTLIIFGAILALMGVIVLISALSGCASTNHYTKVDKISLIYGTTTRHGAFTRAHMLVANPTDKRRHFTVRCCMPTSPNDCLSDVHIIVKPRSDKRFFVTTLAEVSCELLPEGK